MSVVMIHPYGTKISGNIGTFSAWIPLECDILSYISSVDSSSWETFVNIYDVV